MTTIYFDCHYGASGDMILGALLDAGLPLEELREALSSLPVHEYAIETTRVQRCGVSACQLHVRTHEHHPHRSFSTIGDIIASSGLDAEVKESATRIFRRLAEAEAEVHQVDIEKVHFHEVGAVDAIVDIVGAAWGLHRLGIDNVLASTIAVGSGTVRTAHGMLPVPAPATTLLLKGVPIETGELAGELATPTGAAILATLASGFGPMPELRVEKIGYGSGTREYAGHTNFLRALIGRAAAESVSPVESRELSLVQTEIDDMAAEHLGYVLEKAFAAGCLDACLVPIQMKKNRPGTSLQILCAPELAGRMIDIVLRETSSFGVKVIACRRHCLAREIREVKTPHGPVRVKVGFLGGDIVKGSPEYEDCRRVAQETGMPIGRVYEIAMAEARRSGLLPGLEEN